MVKEIESLKKENLIIGSDFYVKESLCHIHIFSDCIYITNLKNALKRGKTCKRYCLSFKNSINIICSFNNWIDEINLDEFINNLFNGIYENRYTGMNLEVREIKGVNVFSPFENIKPIKLPTKWTISHVWKGILSGQIKKVICTGKYSDDYSFDNATNYGKGEKDKISFAKELIEEAGGWHCYYDGINVCVNCHSFDNNILIFN